MKKSIVFIVVFMAIGVIIDIPIRAVINPSADISWQITLYAINVVVVVNAARELPCYKAGRQ